MCCLLAIQLYFTLLFYTLSIIFVHMYTHSLHSYILNYIIRYLIKMFSIEIEIDIFFFYVLLISHLLLLHIMIINTIQERKRINFLIIFFIFFDNFGTNIEIYFIRTCIVYVMATQAYAPGQYM